MIRFQKCHFLESTRHYLQQRVFVLPTRLLRDLRRLFRTRNVSSNTPKDLLRVPVFVMAVAVVLLVSLIPVVVVGFAALDDISSKVRVIWVIAALGLHPLAVSRGLTVGKRDSNQPAIIHLAGRHQVTPT